VKLKQYELNPTCRRAVEEYLTAQGVQDPLRVDVVLALLRVSHSVPEARREAERIMGKPITVCPPHVPPWPPREPEVPSKLRSPRVTKVLSPNPCAPKSDAYRRFALIRVGQTLDYLAGKGITKRDVRVWQEREWLEVAQ
jgi:hypothetical protein